MIPLIWKFFNACALSIIISNVPVIFIFRDFARGNWKYYVIQIFQLRNGEKRVATSKERFCSGRLVDLSIPTLGKNFSRSCFSNKTELYQSRTQSIKVCSKPNVYREAQTTDTLTGKLSAASGQTKQMDNWEHFRTNKREIDEKRVFKSCSMSKLWQLGKSKPIFRKKSQKLRMFP